MTASNPGFCRPTALISPISHSAILGVGLPKRASPFAMYALIKTDVFDRFVSASGSLWFPGFLEKLEETELPVRPKAVYLSLGGKESKTNNPVMSSVEVRTRAVRDVLAKRDINVILEMNSGNHFREPDLRTAKGIKWVLEQ